MVLEVFCWSLAALVSVPFFWLTVECLAALLPPRHRVAICNRPRVAILIPAHNEETGIARTLRAVGVLLQSDDRVLVVADNCQDRTADVARDSGAEVIDRHDLQRRGKGFALDHGIKHLSSNPPEILIVIDA